MATVLERPSSVESTPDVESFARELTGLCRRYGIGLTDGATLYTMEREDFARSMAVNDESELSLA